jgi:hypothetical protein
MTRSTDGGRRWHDIEPLNVSAVASGGGVFYAVPCCTPGTVTVLRPRSTVWQFRHTGATFPGVLVGIVVDSVDRRIVYTSSGFTTDAGRHWYRPGPLGLGGAGSGQVVLTVDAGRPRTVYASAPDAGRYWVSHDAGRHWSGYRVRPGLYVVAAPPTSGRIVAYDGSHCYSATAGATLRRVGCTPAVFNPGADVPPAPIAIDGALYVGVREAGAGVHGNIWRSADGLHYKRWRRLSGGTGEWGQPRLEASGRTLFVSSEWSTYKVPV